MEVRDVIITHVLGPAVLLVLVLRYRPISRLDAVLTAVTVDVSFVFLWFAGRWHLASVWGRPLLAVGIIMVAAICWHRARRLPLYASCGIRSWVLRTAKIALTWYVSVQLAAALAGLAACERSGVPGVSAARRPLLHRPGRVDDRRHLPRRQSHTAVCARYHEVDAVGKPCVAPPSS